MAIVRAAANLDHRSIAQAADIPSAAEPQMIRGFGSVLNPVDIAGTATPSVYERAFAAAFEDPMVSAVYGSVCPSAITNVPAIADVALKVH
ncbi:MAG: hypothetical protein LAO79_26795, partial [Acidobacteriia bacterium]|nr:hypothetical protein [Terriglobia bacterium]